MCGSSLAAKVISFAASMQDTPDTGDKALKRDRFFRCLVNGIFVKVVLSGGTNSWCGDWRPRVGNKVG